MTRQKIHFYSIIAYIIITTIWILVKTGRLGILWIVNLYGAALALSSVSVISVARKTMYLNAAIPHITLFSASLATLVSMGKREEILFLAAIINVFIVLIYQEMMKRGEQQEIATSIIIGLTTSLSVLTLYYLYAKTGYTGEISSLLIGDPLLSTTKNVIITVITTMIVTLTVFLTWKEHVIIGIDREYAVTVGLRAELYDYIYYIILALSSVIYIRTVGYILLHVFVLMPGAISVMSSPGLSYLLATSIVLTILSTSISLLVGLYVNLSPVGLIGVFLLVLYVLVIAQRWRK